jgi:hypothetical protein
MDLTIGVPCRADEPGLLETLESLVFACQQPTFPIGLTVELVVCINGVTEREPSRPRAAVHEVCARLGVPVKEIRLDSEKCFSSTPQFARLTPLRTGTRNPCSNSTHQEENGPVSLQGCLVLLTERLGKPRAWNAIWQRASGETVLFCDADVRVEQRAVAALYVRLERDSTLVLVAAREVPMTDNDDTVWSRMAALPYRFDFGNAGGRLYIIRKGTLPNGMPEDLLLEDAWLTVAVGRQRVVKEPRAQVFFLPPATCGDYFAERVRTEGGKLQIRRQHGVLLHQGPIARYSWRRFWRDIALSEYPLATLALCLRGLARVWAWIALWRRDFYALYHPFPSTKGWTPEP